MLFMFCLQSIKLKTQLDKCQALNSWNLSTRAVLGFHLRVGLASQTRTQGV